jgi:hypothetical protein
VLSERSDRKAVVALRPRIGILRVNPSDQRFCGRPILQSIGQPTYVLGEPDNVTQQLFMAIIGVVVQIQLVGKRE